MSSYATPDATLDPAHECWLHLGKGAGTVWGCLTDSPQGVRQLARAAGVNPSTCTRQLPKLAEHDLAAQLDSGWVTGKCTPTDVVLNKNWLGNGSKTAKRLRDVMLDRICQDIKMGVIAAEEAIKAHPGLESEIKARFGGLMVADEPVMAGVA